MYVTLRSRMSSIMDLLRLELYGLIVLEFAKNAESYFVYLLACTNQHGNNIYDNETENYLDFAKYESRHSQI